MSQTFTDAELNAMPSREYAEHGDRDIGGSETSGWGRDPDAIGGYSGISWYSVFADKNGTRYKVHCHDGERGGRGPYRDED